MDLANIDCVGHNDLYKVVSAPTGEHTKTGDYKEPDYIEADNESHGNNDRGIFCVIENDSDCIDIDDLY